MKARVTFTREVGGTTYHEPAWWGLQVEDEEGPDDRRLAIAGPCQTKREALAEAGARGYKVVS